MIKLLRILCTPITLEWVKTAAAFSLLLFCCFFTISLGWMLWYPYNPIRIDALYVDKTEAHVGDTVCFKMVGEKLMEVPVSVSLELVNGEGVAIMNYSSNVPKGAKFKERCFNIPMHIKSNHYRLLWRGVYPVNGLRNIVKEKLSNTVYITNNLMIGPQGRRGEKGIQGIQGKRGETGAKGGVSLFGKGDKGDPGKDCVGGGVRKSCNPNK